MPTPTFDPMTQAIIDSLTAAYEQGGWLALAGTALMLCVRGIRMTEVGEEFWAGLEKRLQLGAVFGTAAVGALVVAVSTGAPVGMSIPGAVVAGVVAMTLHRGSKAVGARLPSTGNARMDAALKVAFHSLKEAPAAPEQPPAGAP